MLEKLKSIILGNKSMSHNDIISTASSMGFEFLGNNCGEFILSMQDFYKIQKQNTTAFAMKSKIVQKVGKNGIYLEKDGEVVDDSSALFSVIDFFSVPNFGSFKDDYFTQYFCSGDIYISAKNDKDKNIKAFVVDSRTLTKTVADMNIVGFKQNQNAKKYTTEDIYNHIVRRDPDAPFYGMSIYVPAVYDALSSIEVSKRNFYFFKNSARPDVVVMFEKQTGINTEEYKQMLKDFEKRHQGTRNSNKVMASNHIKDIKVLDVNHKDLQLLDLDVLNIKKLGMLFGIDPRLLGFSDDVGAYATMNEIAKHSMESIQTYQNDLEQDMNNAYRQFVDPSFQYIIRLDGETQFDRDKIEEGQRKDVELGIQTIEEVRTERGYTIDSLPEWTKKPVIKTSIGLEPQAVL